MASIETLLGHSTDELEKLLANETELLAKFADAFNLEHKLIDEGLSNNSAPADDADGDDSPGDENIFTPRIRKVKSNIPKTRDEKAREKIERQKAELLELAKLLNQPPPTTS